MISGQASKIVGAGGNGVAQIVHAVFMLLAFCVLMPATGIMARHKWWFTDPKVSWQLAVTCDVCAQLLCVRGSLIVPRLFVCIAVPAACIGSWHTMWHNVLKLLA